MFALNDALEESEMNWQSLLTTLESKYTANISYNLPRVLGQCQDRNVLQSKMEDMVAHVYTHASRGLDWLSTIVTIAPLLGLLGTVTGMIGAFHALGVRWLFLGMGIQRRFPAFGNFPSRGAGGYG